MGYHEKSAIAGSSRVRELANIAFGREVRRKVVDAILPLNDIGRGPAFYCVHDITGCATEFRSMAEMLSPDHKFYGIQVPTAKRNAAFAGSVEHIAQYYANRLNEFQPTGPLILGGHSAGAAIALEVAQRLRSLGRDIPLLIVFDGELFNTGAKMNPDWIGFMLNVPARVRDSLMKELRLILTKRLTFRHVVARIESKLARLSGKQISDPVEEIIDLRKFTSDHAAFVKTLFESQFNYVPKKYLGRVVVCVAKSAKHRFQVEAPWRKIAPAAEVVKFKGTHTSLLHPPDGLAVAQYLKAVFARIDGDASFGRNRPEAEVTTARLTARRSSS